MVGLSRLVSAGVSRAMVAAAMTLLPATALTQVSGEIRGRVTDGESSKPVPYGRVEVSGRADVIRTNADGAYIARGIEPGTYVVVIRALGYAAHSREVTVRNGQTTLLDVALAARVTSLAEVETRDVRDTSALNTTVINRTAIEQSGRRDLGEVIQAAPGVVVTQSGGPGQPQSISIRGSGSNQVLVLVDGVPLNSTISGSADLSRIPLESVESVTVRTGAQSARYGPRAMAGVVEIITRRSRREATVFARAGSLGEKNTSLSVGNSKELGDHNVGVFINGDYRTVDGDFAYTLPALRGGGRATRINSASASKQLLGGLSVDGGFGSASLRFNWMETRRGLAGTIIQPSSTGRQGSERLSVGGSAQGQAGRFGWTVATDVTNETDTYNDHAPPLGQAYHDTIQATGYTFSASTSAGRQAANASMGVEIRALDVSSTMLAPGAPHWQRLDGLWGNTRVSRGMASQLTLDAELSARVDHTSLTSDVVVSPRGSLRLSHRALTASVSLGSGFAPPTLSDQFFNEGVQVRANPALRPERTRQDLEGRLTLRDTRIVFVDVGSEVAAYRSNIEGMILWFPDFRFIWSPTNYDVKRSGWEATGKLGIPRLNIEARGTLNHSDVTYTGGILSGQVAYRPNESASFALAFAPDAFRVDVMSRYIGTRRTVPSTRLNSLAPYWMSDVRVSTSFTALHWAFAPAVGVDNALNATAAMLVDYPFPPRTWNVSLRVRRSTSQ
ncbi:MAG: TonB-dependent receptor [Gemmatimonas sp.]